MTFLPIVARELRVASRRRLTYWLRTGAALGVIVLGTWFFLMMQTESPQTVAKTLFAILTGSAVLMGLMSGVRETSDTISSEKREGTLGLLFLTDLKGYDVVLGKFVASSLNAIYGLFAILPMLAVPLLMGGITLAEVGRVSLVAVNAMFFSLSIGMLVSAFSKSARKAASTTFLLLMGYTGVLPAIAATLYWTQRISVADRLHIMLPSVGFAYYAAWEAAYKLADREFWLSLGITHALGWFCLFIASLVAPRAWKDRPAGARKMRWRERWECWSHGNPAERKRFRKRLLDVNAFFWLCCRARLKPTLVWGTLGLLGCGWFYGWTRLHRD
jgi:ABC-type transport system involved in cytochrome c biogenesis permease component